MSKRPKDHSVGPWAKEKLESLRAYLNYYTRRLKNQAWCKGTWFVDAFAGPGRSPVRRIEQPKSGGLQRSLFDDDDPIEVAAIEYVKGSPRVALETPNPFSHYIFIEKAPDRVKELSDLRDEFPEREIEIHEGDANDELQRLLARGVSWTSNKGVVFLDPFGMHVPWSTIEDLANTQGLEVIINFPWGMAINRLLTKSGEIPMSWQDRLDATFGSGDWRELAYEERSDLIGNSTTKREDSTERILEWFSGRLRAAFGYASSAQLIKNTRGNPLYYLLWAGPHKAGLAGAEYILGRKRS